MRYHDSGSEKRYRRCGRRVTASVAIAFALGGCATAPSSDADPAPSRRAAAPVGPSGPAWISLFNGRDLTGWTPKITGEALGADARETFRVEDGMLVVSYDGYETFGGAFGHLFCNVPYTDYDLRLEYRFTGTQCPGGPGWAYRNSGVMIHGQPPRTMRVDQQFPVSIEVQLLGGDGSTPRATGNLCTPGDARRDRRRARDAALHEQHVGDVSRR